MRVNCFIVGEPKSGTSALCHFLSQHPDIYLNPRHNEIDYFNKDMDYKEYREGEYRHRPKNMREYNRFFKGRKDEKILCDGSTIYLHSKVAARLIQEYNPDAKIIAIFRNPADMLYALYYENRLGRSEDAETFKEALELEKYRRHGEKIPKRCGNPQSILYSERIKYADHLERFLDRFKNVKVLIYEDFKKDNKATYDAVLKFLNVPPFKPVFAQVNKCKKERSWVLQSLVQFLRINNILRTVLPESFCDWLNDTYVKIMHKKVVREPLAFRKELIDGFSGEINKFSKLIGRDLGKEWK